jgi:3-deoxy-D-manno-octulosonate 8-phosphate phosphatase (KDO 8-P phosphatase)
VSNASTEVRALASWIGSREGGRGAVREFAEMLLTARGEWGKRVTEYERQRVS